MLVAHGTAAHIDVERAIDGCLLQHSVITKERPGNFQQYFKSVMCVVD